jgi:hypothetical protein
MILVLLLKEYIEAFPPPQIRGKITYAQPPVSGVLPELAAAGLLQLRDLIAELLDLVSSA